jgi:Flp pilus assembly pilin Flp
MNYLVTYLKPFLSKSDEGQDLLEYALLVALIAIVSIGAVTLAGGKVKDIFTEVSTGI